MIMKIDGAINVMVRLYTIVGATYDFVGPLRPGVELIQLVAPWANVRKLVDDAVRKPLSIGRAFEEPAWVRMEIQHRAKEYPRFFEDRGVTWVIPCAGANLVPIASWYDESVFNEGIAWRTTKEIALDPGIWRNEYIHVEKSVGGWQTTHRVDDIPETTGFFKYDTKGEAVVAAKAWAEAEGISYVA